jgi:lysophospholipase L1-like esterase
MAHVRSTDNHATRRSFLRKVAAATAAALTSSSILSSSGCSDIMKGPSGQTSCRLIGKHNVILFQGDSITDAGRDRAREKNANDPRAMGTGYAFLAASQLLAEHSDAKVRVYNRGISGNKVFQLADRWDQDCIALKPDVVSILIGVNDIWHKLNGTYDGTIEVYERDYRALMERTRRDLPGVKLVICEPFVLRCGAVNDKWFPEFDQYRIAAKEIAADFGALFVPFQSTFDEAVKNVPPDYWAVDGVHPSMAGCYLMTQAWLKAVSKARA